MNEYDLATLNLDEFKAKLTEALQPVIETFTEIWRTLTGAVTELGGSDTFIWLRAYVWACEAHPKWVNILNRTKKRRIRKKYQDRIMRAYLKEVIK